MKAVILAAGLLAATAATAQDLPKTNLKVVGGLSNLTAYQDYEQPFWTKTIPEKSKGQVTADIKGWRESLKDPAKGAKLAADVYGKDLGLDADAATEESKSQNELILNEDTKTNGIMTVSDEMVEETIKSLGFAGLDVTADQIFDLSLIEKIYADNPDLKADPTA